MRDPSALPDLCAALNDPDSYVRYAAARALGEFGDPCVLEPLAEAMEDPAPEVSLAAAKAVSRLDVPERAAVLRKALVAGSIGSRAGVEVRILAATQLGLLEDRESVPILLRALEEAPAVAAAAARALGRIGDPVACRSVRPLLDSGFAHLRLAAIDAVMSLGDAEAVPQLMTILTSLSEERVAAAVALGALGDAGVIGPLCKLLKGSDLSAGAGAAKGLELMSARHPYVELRQALPALARSLAPWPPGDEMHRQAFLSAYHAIEAATAESQALPLPAALATAEDVLPRPAALGPPTGALPGPSVPAPGQHAPDPDEDAKPARWVGFWRRLRIPRLTQRR
jgi:HEAT repeat protein